MGLNRIAVGVLGLSVGLFANYAEGIKYYQDGKFDKAFPIIVKEAEKGTNKAAQYRLAEMYEKGEGTEVDFKKSMLWYKKAASKYSFVNKKKVPKVESTVASRLDAQVGEDSQKAGAEFALGKLSTDTPETKAMLTSLIDGDFFGLQPYKDNYILPVSWSKDKPRRISPTIPYRDIPSQYQTYNENVEVEFQLSLKKELSYNLFGLNEFITAAYTQEVWWQLYDDSGPFRETNYRPELFLTLPSSQNLDDSYGFKATKFGFIHESNGQEGYRSRSWNRLYLTGMFQWDNLFLSARVWYRLNEDSKSELYYAGLLPIEGVIAESDGDDNPDITDYLGYGDININYLYGENKFALMLRNNFNTHKGAVEFTYAYPLFDSRNTNWYVKLFKGYGDSLIDYNVDVTKAAVGFSFSGSLF